MNELISRQAAIDAVLSVIPHDGYFDERAKLAIEELPSAQPERKTGEWLHAEIIDDDDDFGVNSDATQCSICGDYQNSYGWAKTYFHYCPNCGADMRGEQNE